MPISIVVGGQFGSEGKGKVALDLARRRNAALVVRVGGTNSGHTGVDENGRAWALRQLPASILASESLAVLPPGALIDPAIFEREVAELGLAPSRVAVSPHAWIITDADKTREKAIGLVSGIGSTGSGTGAALVRRIERQETSVTLARDVPSLAPYLRDTSALMRDTLNQNKRIVIEGTQGFGLSVLHGGYYPKATSRDTTAAAFLSEAGLSPRDVDDIVLVIRAHPIRVAGEASGELQGETTWAQIAREAGLPDGYQELTTATKKVRRVGRFEPDVVRRAINANSPNTIVLNHFDYVDVGVRNGDISSKAVRFLAEVEEAIGRRIDFVGTGPDRLVPRDRVRSGSASSHLKIATPT